MCQHTSLAHRQPANAVGERVRRSCRTASLVVSAPPYFPLPIEFFGLAPAVRQLSMCVTFDPGERT